MNEIIVNLEGKEYQIDIEKARELGILKKKNAKCQSWEEFRKKYKEKAGFYYTDGNEVIPAINPIMSGEQLTENEAIAIKAFAKLLKLRRDWIGNWEPDWKNERRKYCIVVTSNCLKIAAYYFDHHAFSFPEEDMARLFFYCFRELFEQCKNLI